MDRTDPTEHRELLLKNSNPDAEIFVFSGSRSGAICEEFRNSGFQTVDSIGNGYFEDHLNVGSLNCKKRGRTEPFGPSLLPT